MLIDGILLGTMTTFGFCLIYGKLPPWLKTWCMKHPLAVDIIISCGFYSVMGMTLTAHFAVAAMVLEVQGLLHIARNPEKFLFLQHAKMRAKEALKGLTDKVDQINEEYKRTHTVEIHEVPKQ
jgi:hypothetical protein